MQKNLKIFFFDKIEIHKFDMKKIILLELQYFYNVR